MAHRIATRSVSHYAVSLVTQTNARSPRARSTKPGVSKRAASQPPKPKIQEKSTGRTEALYLEAQLRTARKEIVRNKHDAYRKILRPT